MCIVPSKRLSFVLISHLAIQMHGRLACSSILSIKGVKGRLTVFAIFNLEICKKQWPFDGPDGLGKSVRFADVVFGCLTLAGPSQESTPKYFFVFILSNPNDLWPHFERSPMFVCNQPQTTNFLNHKGWPKWPLIIFQFETKNGRSKSSRYSFFSAVEALSQTLNVLAFVRSLPVQCIATQAISKCAKIAPYGKICC